MPRYSEKEQALVLKLLAYFQLEKQAGKTILPVDAVHERVSAALGISLSTVGRLVNEGIQTDSEYSSKMSDSVCVSHGLTIRKKYEHGIRTCIYRMFSQVTYYTTYNSEDKIPKKDQSAGLWRNGFRLICLNFWYVEDIDYLNNSVHGRNSIIWPVFNSQGDVVEKLPFFKTY